MFLSYYVLCQCVYVYTCMYVCIICFRLRLLLLFACIYVFYVVYRGPHGRLVTPNELPSLNKELTYLLTYYSPYTIIWELFFLYHHFLKHALTNMIRSPFCSAKVLREKPCNKLTNKYLTLKIILI